MRTTTGTVVIGAVLAVQAVLAPPVARGQSCLMDAGMEAFGPFDQAPADVALRDRWAFTADVRGMTVYDVDDPTSPVWVAEVHLNTPGESIALAGDTAWVATGRGGLQWIDISDPTHPALETTFFNSVGAGAVHDVVVDGAWAFAAMEAYGLAVYDLSSGWVRLAAVTGTCGEAVAVAVSGGIACVATGGASTLEIIDVSDPSSPSWLASLPIEGFAADVAVGNGLAYVAAADGGLQVVDISNPAAPVLRGVCGLGGSAYRLTVSGGYAWLSTTNAGLQIVDVTDPDHPGVVGTANVPASTGGVAVLGDLAAVAAGENGLRLVDVSDPTAPDEHGAFPDVAGFVTDVAAVPGAFACVANGTMGFATVDTTVPGSPSWIGFLDTPGYAVAVDVAGDVAYVADWDGGLQIIGVSDPANPVLLAEYATADPAIDVKVVGDIAVVAELPGGIELVNVSTPSAPAPESVLGFSEPANGLDSCAASEVLVANGNGGLAIVDIGDPAHPVLKGRFATAAEAERVACSPDAFAWVMEREADGEIVDLQDSANPLLFATVRKGVTAVAFHGAIAFAATGPVPFWARWPSLAVWDLSKPGEPRVIAENELAGTPYGIAVDAVGGRAILATGSDLELVDAPCPVCSLTTIWPSQFAIQTGGSTATVTVTVRDPFTRPLAGATVEGETTLGTLSAFTDQGNGDATATLTSGTRSGVAAISVELDHRSCESIQHVTFECASGTVGAPGLGATVLGEDAIRLDWTPPSGARGTIVYRSNGVIATLGQGTTTFTDDGLSPATEYCYSVRAIDDCGGPGATYSNSACGTTAGMARQCLHPAATNDLGGGNTVFPYFVSMRDGFVLASTAEGLTVWSVGDPHHPERLGTWESAEPFPMVSPGPGTLWYACDGFNGLVILDTSVPAVPRVVGRLTGIGWAGYVASEGSTAWVVAAQNGSGEALLIGVDASNPSAPAVVGTTPVSPAVTDIEVSGGMLAIAENAAVRIFDVSDPAAPVSRSTVRTWLEARQLALSGNLLAVAMDADMIELFDVSDPTALRTLATADATNGVIADLVISGNSLLVASGRVGLDVLDISDPRHPVPVGTVSGSASYSTGVAVDGDLAVLTYPELGLQMVDIETPSNPTVVGTWTGAGVAVDLAVTGTTAVVANRDAVETIDVTDPLSPVALGSADLPWEARKVAAGSGLALVAIGDAGVQIVDIGDPAHPFLAGRYDTVSSAIDVAVSGTLACVAVEGGGIEVFSVANEFAPSRFSTLPEPADPERLVMEGDMAYVIGSGELILADLSDPAHPFVAGRLTVPQPVDLVLSGSLAFVAESISPGLAIVDIADPTAPRLLGTPGDWNAGVGVLLGVEGTNLYMADFLRLMRADFWDPSQPDVASIRLVQPRIVAGAVVGTALLALDGGKLTVSTLDCREPEAAFDWAVCGLDVVFHDRSLYDPTGWSWSFGDGGASGEGDPVHRFPAYGTYTVSLTASNGSGSDTVFHTVRVGPDLNHDGVVDGLDIADLVAEIYDLDGTAAAGATGGAHLGDRLYDLDGDGGIGAPDVPILIRHQDP